MTKKIKGIAIKKAIATLLAVVLIWGAMPITVMATTIDISGVGPFTINTGVTATVTGPITGNITVDGGTLILNADHTIDGTVGVENGGTFNMSAGTITGAGRGVSVVHNGQFNMSGGIITGNNNASGAGVHVSSGAHFTMLGGLIYDNHSTTIGGGVHVQGFDPIPDGAGGFTPVPASEQTHFTLLGGTIRNNVAATNGGGLYISRSAVATIGTPGGNDSAILIVGNHAIGTNAGNGNGGGMTVEVATVTMYSGTIANNTATNRGGGVRIAHGPAGYASGFRYSHLIMHGGLISDNHALAATGYGGGLSINHTPGAIFSSGGVILTQTGGTISNNTAANGDL